MIEDSCLSCPRETNAERKRHTSKGSLDPCRSSILSYGLGLNHVSFFTLFLLSLSLSLSFTLSFFSTAHSLVHYYRTLRYVHTYRKIVLRVSINDRTQTRGTILDFPSLFSLFLLVLHYFTFHLPLSLALSLFVAYISCFRLMIKHVEIGE